MPRKAMANLRSKVEDKWQIASLPTYPTLSIDRGRPVNRHTLHAYCGIFHLANFYKRGCLVSEPHLYRSTPPLLSSPSAFRRVVYIVQAIDFNNTGKKKFASIREF
jgi:hypothetical protein